METKYLQQCFDVDFEAGILIWRKRPLTHFPNERAATRWNTMFAGKEAGSIGCGGYKRVALRGRQFLQHRLIWQMKHGVLGNKQIDHIDGNKLNNNIKNLRLVTGLQNARNQKLHKNSSGVFGVYKRESNNWQARIRLNGKLVTLGIFPDWFDAVCARKSAENRGGFHKNHGMR